MFEYDESTSPNSLRQVGVTARGYGIFRKRNEAGGYNYWSDEVGNGVMVWNTSLVDVETLKYVIFLHDHLIDE